MNNLTILCISSYEKGFDFMIQAKEEGCRVLLLTSRSLQDSPWPKESIDEIFYMPDINKEWNIDHMINAVSFLARTEKIERIVALDDFDVEKAARLREHLRVPGMGDTTARYFRDKLAMRMKAQEDGINVPPFVHILNYDNIKNYLKEVEPPYVLKPRMQAGAIGIKKINNENELWQNLEILGDRQSYFLLEKFIPGDIFHVDCIIVNKEVLFAVASQYGLPPMEVAHEGRVFSSRTMKRGSKDERKLISMNDHLLKSLGLLKGVSHSEFIKSSDGKFYFLETSARVGGANLADLVYHSTGVNLWREWAKLEINDRYKIPKSKNDYAAILQSLARQEWPDMDSFNDSEVVWRLKKRFHAGLIIASPGYERVEELTKNYTERFYSEFFTSAPVPEKPTE
ncbi:MAG TPA: ATP-grasp domain-containing protein [Melioribacteraceae bacterium]|nr:ATP-grasp domain-containing protein [Melioribacteraceae bacterium]